MKYFSFPLSKKLRQALFLLLFLLAMRPTQAQEQGKGLEVYGYIKADVGYNFNQTDPNWFDVLRVTKLPQYKNQFAPDGKIYFSVRETRLGLNSWSQTPLGQLKANFEFDLFGVGPEVGQTVFRFRKAYVELGRFTVGQTESLFSDVDVTPGTLDFGAPPSRAYLRTIQVRYMRAREQDRWGIALEQPDAVSDDGIYANRIELQHVRAAFKLPDVAAEYRRQTVNGYVEVGGVLKWIRWENTANSVIDLSGQEIGWGFNLSSTQQLDSKTSFKGQLVYGKGVESHLTDAGPDIGIENNFEDPTTPVLGVSLPVLGGLAFLERSWNSKWSSTVGYSRVHIKNSDAQAATAFKNGNYAILNLLHQPFPQSLVGAELQWGKRNNFRDGFSSSTVRVQFSFKYNFSHSFFANATQ
ncbi:DcaP family trimeric outer membrane transporter [Rufibacter sp. XAAS-G3-1]|uniref:DcaP family trimeric outer membrane transporter n=1 Tax=Rufibacter sp. XAAS-G3-1 TaxID=2729134 RepID=UPI0015E6D9A3|nr:DcaP family trimeric outer membrane transporter [Rufibacter sp. XAAS-G3-1]